MRDMYHGIGFNHLSPPPLLFRRLTIFYRFPTATLFDSAALYFIFCRQCSPTPRKACFLTQVCAKQFQLHRAAKTGDTDRSQELLGSGCHNMRREQSYRRTPPHIAICTTRLVSPASFSQKGLTWRNVRRMISGITSTAAAACWTQGQHKICHPALGYRGLAV